MINELEEVIDKLTDQIRRDQAEEKLIREQKEIVNRKALNIKKSGGAPLGSNTQSNIKTFLSSYKKSSTPDKDFVSY